MNEQSHPQNIIYIMLDDADFGDFSYNNSFLKDPDSFTPNIDFLRNHGREFTSFYAGSSICTPTRASFLTGENPAQFGAYDAWPQSDSFFQNANGATNGLPNTIPQVGILMKNLGLRTGHFGKWHVGLSRERYSHQALGFEDFSYHQRIKGQSDPQRWDGIYEVITEEGSTVQDLDFLDSYFSDQLIDFIDTSLSNNEPFFANYWPISPHFPWAAPRTFDNQETQFDLSTNRGQALAMLYTVDQEIGRIVSTLENHGTLNDTLIIVTSDNGGQSKVQNSMNYLRGNKGNLFEGGIHVPMLAFWPNGIEAGSRNSSVITTTDLLPTFLDLLGQDVKQLDQDVTGDSKAAAFISDQRLEHDGILWQLAGGPTEVEDSRAQVAYAYREGDYKIIKAEGRNDLNGDNSYFLFNIADDPREQNNLRKSHRSLLQIMKRKLLLARGVHSYYDNLPQKVTQQKVISFDPRFDPTTRDMTLSFDIIVPNNLTQTKDIFHKPGTQRVRLRPNGTIWWRVFGSDNEGQRLTGVLQSKPLTAGKHNISLSIGGFKSSDSRISLIADGQTVDELDNGTGQSGLSNLWSTQTDLILGDDGIRLDNLRYFNMRFYQDELNIISEQLFQDFEDTQASETVEFNRQLIQANVKSDALKMSDDGDTYSFNDVSLPEVSLTTFPENSDSVPFVSQIKWGDGAEVSTVSIDHIDIGKDIFLFQDGTTLSGFEADFLKSKGGKYLNREDDRLYGTNEDDIIRGTDSSDRIFGLKGDDDLSAGKAQDDYWQYLYGSDGNDTYHYSTEHGRVFLTHASEDIRERNFDSMIFEDLLVNDIEVGFLDYDTPQFSNRSSSLNGSSLRLQWSNQIGSGELRLANEGAGIESYHFSDGTILTHTDFRQLAL